MSIVPFAETQPGTPAYPEVLGASFEKSILGPSNWVGGGQLKSNPLPLKSDGRQICSPPGLILMAGVILNGEGHHEGSFNWAHPAVQGFGR